MCRMDKALTDKVSTLIFQHAKLEKDNYSLKQKKGDHAEMAVLLDQERKIHSDEILTMKFLMLLRLRNLDGRVMTRPLVTCWKARRVVL
jgi:hypothetical protein